jgi:hypothetical protein
VRRLALAFLAVLAGPLAALFAVPLRLAQSLWRSRVLASGKGSWNRFTARAAFNSLFYWTMALNLERYGRRGVSSELGTGDFPLRRWLAHDVIPLLAYRHLGAILPLAGMLAWWFGHLLWIDAAPLWWALAVFVLTGISTTFYSNTFVLQNYNAAGWAFFSAGLYALLTKQVGLLTLMWLGVSFMSPTVLLFGGAATVAVAFADRSPWLLLALVPAGVKMLTHFWYLVTGDSAADAVGFVARGIGVTKQGARYKHALRLKLGDVYLLVLAVQFLGVAYFRSGRWPVVLSVAVAVFVVNSSLMRFADHQSVKLFLAGAAAVEAFLRPDPLVLLSYWYAVSPGPAFVQWDRNRRYLFDVPVYEPYSLERARELAEDFLRPVPDHARVFMAFDDPGESHSKIFDGLGPCRELVHYFATLRRIHFMPDWWAVFHLNYPDAPSLWGRQPAEVAENLARWQAQYAVIYQKAGEPLAESWEAAGFTARTRLSWPELAGDAGDDKVPGHDYDFWLLERSAA